MSLYWCFTNNSTDLCPEVYLKGEYKFLIYQLESGENTGHFHYQGYVVFNSKKKLATLKKLCSKSHWEMRKGSHNQALEYCEKEDTRLAGPWKYGDDSDVPKGKGERTDIKRMAEAIFQNPDMDLTEEFGAELIKFPGGVQNYRNAVKNRHAQLKLTEEFNLFKPNYWQELALHKLNMQNDRKVLWIIDEEGGRGKTYLAKFLVSSSKAFYVQQGKKEDFAYAFDNQPIICFDYTRADKEYVNYSAIESFKNGMIWSPKYQAITKICTPPKIICFSNWSPDLEKLSRDRWEIMNLEDYPDQPKKKTKVTSPIIIDSDDDETQIGVTDLFSSQ